jgi:hypothetical protein
MGNNQGFGGRPRCDVPVQEIIELSLKQYRVSGVKHSGNSRFAGLWHDSLLLSTHFIEY